MKRLLSRRLRRARARTVLPGDAPVSPALSTPEPRMSSPRTTAAQAHERLDEAARLHQALQSDVRGISSRQNGYAGLLSSIARNADEAHDAARAAQRANGERDEMIDALARRVSDCEDAMHAHPSEGDSAEADELAAWQRNVEEQLGTLSLVAGVVVEQRHDRAKIETLDNLILNHARDIGGTRRALANESGYRERDVRALREQRDEDAKKAGRLHERIDNLAEAVERLSGGDKDSPEESPEEDEPDYEDCVLGYGHSGPCRRTLPECSDCAGSGVERDELCPTCKGRSPRLPWQDQITFLDHPESAGAPWVRVMHHAARKHGRTSLLLHAFEDALAASQEREAALALKLDETSQKLSEALVALTDQDGLIEDIEHELRQRDNSQTRRLARIARILAKWNERPHPSFS